MSAVASAPSLADPAVLLDPYPTFNWIRDHDPVYYAADLHAWIITKYAEVAAAVRDPRLSVQRVNWSDGHANSR